MPDMDDMSDSQDDKPRDNTPDKDADGNSGASSAMTDEERIKLMARVVCICKGINLGRVLKGLEGCETVADVNRKVGTGSGGCRGERCGPRIKTLLRKQKELKKP